MCVPVLCGICISTVGDARDESRCLSLFIKIVIGLIIRDGIDYYVV